MIHMHGSLGRHAFCIHAYSRLPCSYHATMQNFDPEIAAGQESNGTAHVADLHCMSHGSRDCACCHPDAILALQNNRGGACGVVAGGLGAGTCWAVGGP